MDFFSRVIEFLFFTISSDYSIVSRESVATRKLGSVRGTSTQGKSPTENAFCSSATSFRQTWNLALLYEALSASRARGGEVLPAQKNRRLHLVGTAKARHRCSDQEIFLVLAGRLSFSARSERATQPAFRSRPGTCRLTVTTPHCVRVAASLTDDGSGQSFRTRPENTPTRPEKQSHSSVGFVLQSANYVQSKPLKVDGRLLLHGMWVLRSANPVQEDQGKVNPKENSSRIRKNYAI